MVRDVGLTVVAAFGDDEMAMLFLLLIAHPLHETPSELFEERMVSVPSFKVHGEPRPELCGPQSPDALEDLSSRPEERARALQPLVVLLDVLCIITGTVSAPTLTNTPADAEHICEQGMILAAAATATAPPTGTTIAGTVTTTYFDCTFQDSRVTVHVGRAVAQVSGLDEVLGGRDWDGISRQSARVQPVAHVFDLGRGEEETHLVALECACNCSYISASVDCNH